MLQERLPLQQAMPELLPRSQPPADLLDWIREDEPKLQPLVAAGVWMYLDQLDRSHDISQGLPSKEGSWWHAIMHRREGDYWNSKYWYRQVGRHEAMGFDPAHFVDECEKDHGANTASLIHLQQQEWQSLMDWCLKDR